MTAARAPRRGRPNPSAATFEHHVRLAEHHLAERTRRWDQPPGDPQVAAPPGDPDRPGELPGWPPAAYTGGGLSEWRAFLSRRLFDAITDARMFRNRLSDEQCADPICLALSARLDEVERLKRDGPCAPVPLEVRHSRVRARLAQEPDSPLKAELLALLCDSGTD